MRLIKIRLSGFKSFVDPTTIQFPSNLMAIVGPNGCGKSNVIDAIRWVLGESSAKTLRGDSMADVIFNGSSSRKPVGQASIELIFDNSDGTISGPYAGYSEVAVRRVVARDGTSQYYLNNARCRRKDITHILLGTGLGSHGYSIIEQGMISRLVEAKPEELRAFLEEAAGISKYKDRRRDTEHRIRHTRENLERLSDLRDEVDKHLGHLQRQAKAAERYKTLKAEERKLNAELLALRLGVLRAEAEHQDHAQKEKQLALDAATTAQGSIEADIEKLRVELADRTEAFNTVQGNYYKIGAEVARLEQSIQHRKAMIQRQREDLEETERQLEETSGHLADDQVELERLDQVLGELNPELEESNRRVRESEQALEQAEHRMEQHRERWDRQASELAETMRAIQVEEARLEQLTAQRERLSREHAEQVAERESIDFDAPGEALAALITDEERLKAACAEATRSLDRIWSEIQQLNGTEQQLSTERDQLRERLEDDRGRLSSLEALQEAAFGESAERVDAWLAGRSIDAGPRLAESLVVERGWQRAVETVLGGYLQAVGIDDIERVLDGLTELAETGVTLLENRGDAAVAEPAAGGREPLATKVSSPVSAHALLRGVYTAETASEAMAVRRALADGESVVTPDGLWVGRTWLRINSGDDPQVGVLARGEEIERLREAVAASARDADAVAQRLADTRTRLEELEAARAQAQAHATEQQEQYAETRTQLESKRTQLEQLRSRAATLDRSIDSLADEQRELTGQIDACRGRLKAAQARRDELEAEQPELERERSEYQAALAAARSRAEEDRTAAQDLALKIESRRSSKESATAALTRVQSQQQNLIKRQAELKTQIEQAGEPLSEDERTLEQRLDERLRIEQELSEARAAVDAVQERMREAETARNEQQQRVAEARDAMETARLAVREAQVRAETVAEQFAETGLELESVQAELPADATSEAWAESVEKVERRIQRLGAINLAAIEEYNEQLQRKEYLDKQYNDLTEALETLENAIRRIDRETRTRFKETFDKANQEFGRLFPRLFGGGHAYLELDGDDLLSSGVTIMARPPGKKNSTIHLLSGGEKALTAVALVFSIFELNPAPFCLLDEVDAPLDDANVSRFADIVKEMSERVQFIIITHNKTTMEVMHQLTGVTMQEPGVSRLVAVDIDEAVELAVM